MSHLPLSSLARRLAPVVLVVALAAGSGSAIAATVAPATPSGPCTAPDGVTVVVDFTDLGGQVEVGCAMTPANGTAALEAAGFADTRDAAQMICAINDAPKPCPATFAGSYWSYWHAEPGGSWSYGTAGAGSSRPIAGSIDGWSFGNGKPPSSRPPMAVATRSGAAIAGAATTGTATALGAQPPASASRNLPPDGRGGLIGLATGVAIVVLLGAMTGYLALRRQRAGD